MSFATIISSLAHVKTGRLRALAVTPGKRAPALPHIPALSKAGVDLVVMNWYGLIAPAGTSKSVINRISVQTAKAMKLPDVRKRLVAEGSEAVGSSPQDFSAHIRAERERWSKVIQQAEIRGR
ncbi:MAG: tripartite tricarboxylate transporter substrate-binding protein [Betaproteobacteria bacterium]|nr:tripartite tricarboxylate transporter substrate-binding protein [Betaproteobacteria bacterium]MDH3437609.1 tripartite tricarboxylate transporter substrate-binding protein [Betaproteobacteria bacterium]